MSVVEQIWFDYDALSMVARFAMWPFSRAYAGGVAVRTRLYDAGVLTQAAPALPTISVGNLTTGGTGKTPIAAWIASLLASRGERPAIVMRGYGDDEPDVHRLLNPGIPVVVGADRVAGVRQARLLGATVAVLDDAFQHRRIGRDADIALVSVEQLLRPRRLLPSGPWREPLSAARRASLIVLTRKSASLDHAREAAQIVGVEAPRVPIAAVHIAPSKLVSATGAESLPLEALRGKRVLAVAAIGEPGLFRGQLEQAHADVSLAAFRDHHAYTEQDVRELAGRAGSSDLVVCTLKDVVKLGGRWPGPSRLWYVSQQLVVEQGAELVTRLLTRVLEPRAAAAPSAG